MQVLKTNCCESESVTLAKQRRSFGISKNTNEVTVYPPLYKNYFQAYKAQLASALLFKSDAQTNSERWYFNFSPVANKQIVNY